MSSNGALEGQYVEILLGGKRVNVHFHDLGNRESKRPPLVMLHGSGPGASGERNFSANYQHFVTCGFRVILVDWPGWGKSDAFVCQGPRSGQNAHALRQFLDALKLQEPVHLLGNSMGAHSVAYFAIENPESIAKLVLVSGGNGGRSLFHAAPTEGFRKILGFYQKPCLQTMQDFLDVLTFRPPSKEAALARLEATMSRPDHIHSFCESFRLNPLPYPDLSDKLPGVRSPTLVIWGREDRIVPLDMGLRITALLPEAEMHIFGQCGHAPHLEQAQKFNRLVASFLLGDPTGD